MSGAGLEAELKFRAASEAPLMALERADRLGPAPLGPPRTFDELDRYLDTRDRRLGEARWACRLRTREGRTLVSLKGPARHRAASRLHVRPEVEGPADDRLDPAAWPASEARELLTELTGGGPLVERLALRQRRTERSVAGAGDAIGTLSIDRVVVERDGAPRGAMLIVELEFADAETASRPIAADLESALHAIPELEPETASKLERALEMLDERVSPRAEGGG